MAGTFTPTPIVAGVALPGAVSNLYTVPGLTTLEITQFTVTNTDALAHKVSVYLSPTSSLAQAASSIWSGTLSPGQSFSVYQAIGQILGAGSTIQAGADLDSVVSCRVSGILVS